MSYATKPLKVGIYILPNNQNSGMLESLYLASLANQAILECVERCIRDMEQHCPATDQAGQFGLSANRAKAKTLCSFMATAKVHNRLGHATKDGYWNLEHASLAPLKAFLQEI